MDFFKKILGSKTSPSNQDHFVVDENGIAQDSKSFTAPISNVSTPVSNSSLSQNKNISEQGNVTENTPEKNDVVESVSDTSAFDELMKQAESSVDSRVLDKPILDPEFQKAKDEIQSEEGIEIFPAE